ncbi:MDR family MFS transporter [Pseudonocardia spinosispora]|uniref:MDR family MFS transporter n=1 Tax=Pseudonocardia spinosispora TaxID=103441 RepID=UPI0003FCA2C6|nr:MDR family MFS transporter [Pseudonocardia spinosispora]
MSTPGATTADATTTNWLTPLLVLMVGSFLPPMDSSIVNVAISYIQKDLGGGADDVAWVSTAYSLGLAVFVPTSNWLANRFGLTLLHRMSMIGFLVGTTLCGLAWDLDSLVVFRVLEAVPGSILPVITITMIYRIVPKNRIGAAMGIYGLGVVVAPGLGPTIGGLLVEDLSWRWVFYFKVPLGVLAVIAGLFVLPKLARGATVHRFDWWGFLTIGYGLAALVVVSSKGQKWHWDSYPVMILIVSALLSLALFAVIENEIDHPLIDLRVLRSWPFVNSLLMIGALMIGLFAMSYYLPEFLENVQGYTAGHTGMLLLPQSLVGVVLVPVVGRLYDRFGARWLAFSGLVLVALASYLLTGINVDMTREETIVWTVVRGLGTGLAFMPIMTNGLNWLPPHLVGYGGAMNNIMQRMSSALGVAAMGILLTREGAQLSASAGSLQTTSALPQFQHADQLTLLGLYQQTQAHVQATADADMFMAAAAATAVCAGLALMLRRASKRAAPAAATSTPGSASRPVGRQQAVAPRVPGGLRSRPAVQ